MNALSVFSKLLLTTTAMATINFLAASDNPVAGPATPTVLPQSTVGNPITTHVRSMI